MLDGDGCIWTARPATADDVEVIAALVGSSTVCAAHAALTAVALLDACPVLRILFRDNAAAGVCGVRDSHVEGVDEMPTTLEVQVVVIVGDGLDAADAAEAADRLVGELAASIALSVGDSPTRPSLCLAAL